MASKSYSEANRIFFTLTCINYTLCVNEYPFMFNILKTNTDL